MLVAYDPSTKAQVTTSYQQASSQGLTVARSMAYSNGGSKPLQYSPGNYNEQMFQALDFVISEAANFGIHLIFTLGNNWNDYGGKDQYVQWARDQGQQISSDDGFFTNPLVKQFYKNNIQVYRLF
ncbi:hypothetical protein Droror1_Dr00007524 [Drosera rotundifolia]